MKGIQQAQILACLYDGKEHSSSELRNLGKGIVQAVTRVHELQIQGYKITRTKLASTDPRNPEGAKVAWYRWLQFDPMREKFAESHDFRKVEPFDPKQEAQRREATSG